MTTKLSDLVNYVKSTTLIIICLVIPYHGYGQEVKIFEGRIEDHSTGDPLAFVNITVGNIGMYSNLDGNFKLLVPTGIQNASSTVEISSVGYKTIRLLLDTIKSTNTYRIRMEPDIYELDEVVITGKSIKIDAKDIVKKAIGNLSNYINTDEYILETFFKQSHYYVKILSREKKYLRYLEAALLLKSDTSQHNFKSIVKEVRKSNDYRDSYSFDQPDEAINKEDQNFNFENDFLTIDYARPYMVTQKEYSYVYDLLDPIVGNLNNNFVYRHKFKLNTITKYNDRLVYVIDVLPSKKSTVTEIKVLKDFFIPKGRLYIAGDMELQQKSGQIDKPLSCHFMS